MYGYLYFGIGVVLATWIFCFKGPTAKEWGEDVILCLIMWGLCVVFWPIALLISFFDWWKERAKSVCQREGCTARLKSKAKFCGRCGQPAVTAQD